MARERRTVHYSGHVQGVGFRWTTMRALEDLALAGYVRNLADGRVELVVEGTPEEIGEGLRRIRAALGAHIDEQVTAVAPATGEFKGFGVRR